MRNRILGRQIRNVDLAKQVLTEYKKELIDAPASKGHHLNVRGGLLRHLHNVYKVAKHYFPKDKQLQFIALIHDIGKAMVYKWVEVEGNNHEMEIKYTSPTVDHNYWTVKMLEEIGIKLTAEELNAIQFHHGGWSKYRGTMTLLAVKIHFCDNYAATCERDKNGEVMF